MQFIWTSLSHQPNDMMVDFIFMVDAVLAIDIWAVFTGYQNSHLKSKRICSNWLQKYSDYMAG